MVQTMEPVRTIYTEDWVCRRSDLERLIEVGRAGPLPRALAQLEAGWENVRPLEVMCETREPESHRDGAEDAILDHVEMEIVDLFRWIAGETLGCIWRPGARSIAASVDDLETEVEALRRKVRMALLAVQGESVPESMRAVVTEQAAPLLDWSFRFAGTVNAIRRHLDTSGIGEEDE